MDDDIGVDDDERAIELSSISAIFPELILDPSKPFEAILDLQVAPEHPLKIRFPPAADGAPPGALLPTPTTSDDSARSDAGSRPPGSTVTRVVPDDVYDLTHLPPLTVRLALPEGYPADKPPQFNITIATPWVPKSRLTALEQEGVRLWEELGHDQVVYAYIDHVQQAAEKGFGLVTEASDTLSVPQHLKIALLDFDNKAKRERFEKETFDCGICLEPKKGSVCHRILACSHVFCVQCLQDFYNNSITEGDVDSVKCLEPSCGRETQVRARGDDVNQQPPERKKRRKDPTLNPSELLQIPIAQELVQRYVQMKRKKKLEADSSTVYCPRQWCQGAARSKKHPKPGDLIADNEDFLSDMEEEEEQPAQTPVNKKRKSGDKSLPPMSERLCICEDCSYAFCSVCNKGWHGELAACDPRKQAELTAEEMASAEYIKLHTTKCPTCSSPSQKSMGCNHMICHMCKTHFCYLCSSYLDSENPYKHFNKFESTCYMRLWELEGGDGGVVDHHQFFGANDNWVDEESDDEFVRHDNNEGGEDEAEEGIHDNIRFEDESDSEDDVWVPGPQFAQRAAADNGAAPNNHPPPAARERGIAFLNFARDDHPVERIVVRLPHHPPPPAPNPPIRRNQPGPPGFNRQDHRQRNAPQVPRAAAEAAPAPVHDNNAEQAEEGEEQHLGHEIEAEIGAAAAEAEANQRMERAAAVPGQRRDAAQQPAPVRAMGLERFLELARQNREDEWDSDEEW